jgi:hypothetical protein
MAMHGAVPPHRLLGRIHQGIFICFHKGAFRLQ